MTSPQEKSEDNAQKKSSSEEPTCLGQFHQAQEKHTEHNNQANWVRRHKVSRISWHDFGWVVLGAVGDSLAHQLHYTPLSLLLPNGTVVLCGALFDERVERACAVAFQIERNVSETEVL